MMMLINFLPTSTKQRALYIVPDKVWLQRRLIGVKGVEEGNRISLLRAIIIIIFLIL